jgi:lauroyl/myristoyl acyltransferase
VVHLSRAEHGFSKTGFGIRFLNPIRRSREDRYLNDRIMFDQRSAVAAGRRLHRVLASNGVVSITMGAWQGNRVLDVPLLGMRYPVATGAFALARSSGAPVLSVAAIRDHQRRVTRVVIEPPLHTVDSSDRLDAIWKLGIEAADGIEKHVRQAPGQWRGWQYLRPGR